LLSRLLKNGHLPRFPHPSSLRRTAEYASLLRISGALHLSLFEQPGKDDVSSSVLKNKIDSPKVTKSLPAGMLGLRNLNPCVFILRS
jgi:hypothetical protein